MDALAELSGQLLQANAEQLTATQASLGIGTGIVLTVLIIFFCIVGRKLFKKAGYKGYESLINGHNLYTYIIMAKRPGWYFFLFIVPYVLIMLASNFLQTEQMAVGYGMMIVGVIAALVMYIDLTWRLGNAFGKGKGFNIGLILLPIVFFPILGFDGSKYKK